MTKIALSIALALLVGCADQEQSASSATSDMPVLRIATEGAYAPFNYTNADGSLAGFDVDIANGICAKLQRRCEIVAQDWDGIIPALKSGKYDAIVAAMSVTPERSAQVDFSEPYFANSLVFLAQESSSFNPDNTAEIEQANIGAQRSTISSQWLQKTYPKVQASYYDTLNNAFLDLAAGRVEVMIADKAPALAWLQTDAAKGFTVKGSEIDIDDEVAVAVDKGNSELLNQINTAIKEMKADGSYETIVQKNFGAN